MQGQLPHPPTVMPDLARVQADPGRRLLTNNELLAFIAYSGVDRIDALGDELDALLQDDAIAARVEAGTELLKRRALLHEEGDDLTFAPVLAALVGSASRPEALLSLSRSIATTPPDTVRLAQTPALVVSVRSADLGLWLFEALPTPDYIDAEWARFLAGLCPVDLPPALALQIPFATFAQLTDTLQREEFPAAVALLVAAGMAPEDAETLVMDLTTRRSWNVLAAGDLRRMESPTLVAATVVNSATHCWLIQPTETRPTETRPPDGTPEDSTPAADEVQGAIQITAVTAAAAAQALTAAAATLRPASRPVA